MLDASISRRRFLGTTAAVASAALMGASAPKKRIALIGTVDRTMSHTQHFLDRFLVGFGWNGEWARSRVDLVSVYIDQFPKEDLAKAQTKKFGARLYPTLEEALTLGGEKLGVDGVVVIGEHGNYPRNDQGQTLYPRYSWFKRIVGVFEKSGRAVPVFNDKHLSTVWSECAEMVADSKRLGFPFLAGSSLPVTWRLPSIDMPLDTPLSQSVCVAYGGVDSYDFHGLETAQCMSERRAGGEVGIARVRGARDEKIWEPLERSESTLRLFLSALSRSHNLPVENGYPTDPISLDWAKRVFKSGYAYFIEHRDGFKTSLFMLPIRDFNYAGLNSKTGEVVSTQMYLPMPGQGATTANFFNPLVRHIEEMVISGKVPYPVERTLLTSGMTLAGVQSLHRGGAVVETPEMAVKYSAFPESAFQRT
ncbi:MAG: twin-arginine translocation signal domain-containing protein [Isosphaeraceae bacterium]|nr:twin-arginine translocation signal domain-containing protein [Isosphaeraceae bacterium]